MKNLYHFSTNNSFTAENRLVFMTPGEKGPTLAQRLNGHDKLPSRTVKKGDRLYNRMMKRASTKLSASHFKRRLSKNIIPKMAKKYVDKKLAAYGMKDVGGKKARKLARLMAKEAFRFTDVASLRVQSATNIGREAFKTAGYTPKESDGPTISMSGKKSMYEEYKNPCSKMNGKVPKAKLNAVIRKAKTIAYSGIDSAVTDKMEPQLKRALSKYASTALSG